MVRREEMSTAWDGWEENQCTASAVRFVFFEVVKKCRSFQTEINQKNIPRKTLLDGSQRHHAIQRNTCADVKEEIPCTVSPRHISGILLSN